MKADGIYARVNTAQMSEGIRRYWDFYNQVPDAPLYQTELNGFYSLDAWAQQGLSTQIDPWTEFALDQTGRYVMHGCGGVEAGFVPLFEETVLEDRGAHELVRDIAGRSVLFFKNRRSGFMPSYVDHPVKDLRSWEENCAWRMDPSSPARQRAIEESLPAAIEAAGQGMFMSQHVIGGYMYLRSLVGPTELLYMFYDQPELIHKMMETWYDLADSVIARHQAHLSFDEFFIGEDICYNHGSLISPDMIRAFLLPYYQQILTHMNARRLDKCRPIHFQVDTDGFSDAIIDLYRSVGMDFLCPFEVASGCDVVRTGQEYPTLRMAGGIDKRVLARSKQEIDRMVDRILPAMRRRGGYLVTTDHGVPAEVPLENYRHFRKRCMEFGR